MLGALGKNQEMEQVLKDLKEEHLPAFAIALAVLDRDADLKQYMQDMYKPENYKGYTGYCIGLQIIQQQQRKEGLLTQGTCKVKSEYGENDFTGELKDYQAHGWGTFKVDNGYGEISTVVGFFESNFPVLVSKIG